MLLRLSGRRASVSRENPFNSLGKVAFVLPFSMLLLVPVGHYDLNLFFPALLVLVGAHYLPFASLCGMRMFLFLAGMLIAMGVVVARYFSGMFRVHGAADSPYSFSLGLGAPSRPAKLPPPRLTNSPDRSDESGPEKQIWLNSAMVLFRRKSLGM